MASWDEALDLVAERLGDLGRRFGPDSIGVLGSARATNEENYLAQKLARVAIGTNNVDCCARVCHAPSAAALKAMLGTGASTNAFDDIEAARTILVCGANPTENHPIVGARIRQAVRRGARLIVIDPRTIELAHLADVHLAPRPGTNVPLLNAMAHVIVTEHLQDEDFVSARVDDWPAFAEFVRDWPPERAAGLCGVEPSTIREAARLYATARPSMSVHGLGLTEHGQGTEGVMCLINLALITGNIGRPGSGVNPLRGQNNVQGSAMMGCDPSVLTGGASIAAARERVRGRVARRDPGAPRPAPDADDGRRVGGPAQGAVGHGLRRLLHQPAGRRHARRPEPPGLRHRAGSVSQRDRARPLRRCSCRPPRRSRSTGRS